jgi:predicted phosphodiesterase
MATMRIALISDVHGDLPALDAALAHAHRLGCELVLCAGDLVDGDALADEVIARLAADSIPTIRGNHDRWALERAKVIPPKWARRRDPRREASSLMYQADEAALFGGGAELSRASIAFLADLPTSWSATLAGVRVVMWHASLRSDMEGIYPATTSPSQIESHLRKAEADVLLVGHTHEAFAVRTSGGLVANPGALWRGASGGTFGVLTLPAREFRIYRALTGELVADAACITRDGQRK